MSKRLTYSVPEVAEILGISKWLAYKAINRGEIPHKKIGNRIIIPKEKFNDWLGSNTDMQH